MPSFSLQAYAVRIIDRKTDSPLNLSLFAKNLDLFDVLYSYLKYSSGINRLDNVNRSYQVLSSQQSGRILKGQIRAGNFGQESDIVNTYSGDDKYHKNTDEADLVPYFYHFYIPKNLDEGILLTQRNGNSSIFPVIKNIIMKRFNDSFPNVKLSLNPLIPREIIDKIIKDGAIQELKLTRFYLNEEESDALIGEHKEVKGEVSYIVKLKEGDAPNLKKKLKEFFEKKVTPSDIVEIEGFEYQSSSVIINIAGKPKTINLGDLAKVRGNIDISETVVVGDDGHPIPESIEKHCLETTIEFCEAISIPPPKVQ